MKKKVVVGFLVVFLIACLGAVVYWLIVQQNRNSQRLDSKIKAFEQRITALEIQPRPLEDVEKMELVTKLADANVKVINTEFSKFERELRDANDKWLFAWTSFFAVIIAVILTIIGVALWFSVKSLIADRVEKHLNGFKEALAQVDTLKNELKEAIGQVDLLKNKIRVLDKEHAADVIERTMHYLLSDEDSHPREIKGLSEESILDVLRDGTRNLHIRIRSLEILTHRESPRLISPAFELLNSIVDSHWDEEMSVYTANDLRNVIDFLGLTPTQDTYEGLTKFLNRLLSRENTEFKGLLLAATVSSIARVSRELNTENWVSLLKSSISRLDNEPETIKDTLYFLDDTSDVDDLEDYLLELLESHDTEFVRNRREQRANANTETEETL